MNITYEVASDLLQRVRAEARRRSITPEELLEDLVRQGLDSIGAPNTRKPLKSPRSAKAPSHDAKQTPPIRYYSIRLVKSKSTEVRLNHKRIVQPSQSVPPRQKTVQAELDALKHRPVPQSLDELRPRMPPPPNTTAMQAIIGQWPGDETEEELLAALKSTAASGR